MSKVGFKPAVGKILKGLSILPSKIVASEMMILGDRRDNAQNQTSPSLEEGEEEEIEDEYPF